jgi:ankyrin repeat protein
MDGATPLHRAVQSGAVAVIDCLLAAGAEVDVRERKWQGTPMSWAVVLGKHRAAERLALVTRDVRALVRSGRMGRLETVLQQEPGRVNEVMAGHQDPTALYCLPDDEEQAADLTRLLLSYGADVSIRNSRGQTAAEAALARGLDAAAILMDPSIGADA